MANVAAGSYLVLAKTTLVQIDNDDKADTVVCTLDAGGGVTDTSEVAIGRGKDGTKIATVSLQLVKTLASTGSVVLSCNNSAHFAVSARHSTISRIAVNAVTRSAVTG
jgi:hypothetical protein